MPTSSGVQAIHSTARSTSWMWPSWANSGRRLAERGALVQPQQVAGGEHGADRGDHHVDVRKVSTFSPAAGL